ncbi:uncharacterized protein A1O9_09885 [Exophiala aquamarina CBS 119918]|uniref:DUF7905 domain-containing protein n=1 Tax=Exophiala aquamarina CBS 119918 TaxID=1182545 RepID=A0A072PET2_9EURO|nr:uncharacterized protein A1O9_09885 [Exophiala aquamarina CBS 119918]KEF54090.1 hypothetical protein A1O9_09885 [Exophiala aquamarina CBS 119918]
MARTTLIVLALTKSDSHEGAGLEFEKWDDASLIGSSIYSFAGGLEASSRSIFVNGLNSFQTSAQYYVPQRGAQHVTQNGVQIGTRNVVPNDVPRGASNVPPAPSAPPEQRAGLSSHVARERQYGNMIANRAINGKRGPGRQPSPPPAHSAAHASRLRDEPATGDYDLSVAWRTLRMRCLRVERGSRNTHPLQKLQEIGVLTKTYLLQPSDDESKILIWGTPDQVAEAKKALARFENELEAAPKGPHAQWFKAGALDGRAEHRQEIQATKKLVEEALKKANMKYPIEAALLWPKELDITEFSNDNAEAFDDMRRQYYCKIDFRQDEKGPPWMKVSVEQRNHLAKIISRTTNIVKEHVAKRDKVVKVSLIHYPDFSIYRQEVGLLDQDPNTRSHLPTMHGEPGSDEEEWLQMRKTKHLANRRRIKTIINQALKSLAISQRHVRMRVAFGELGFVQFQKPSEGRQSYRFEEFYNMVTEGRTKFSLNSLPVRQGEIKDLADVLSSMDAFKNPSVSYGAFFDFAGSSSQSIVRLECVFGTYGGEEEQFDIREQRWIEVNEMVGKLQLSLFNFERPDYQFTIDAFPLYENKRINKEQAIFQNNVSFKPPSDGIKSPPRLRVKFPPTSNNLRSISDLTTMKWRFKNTDAVFELRRKDIYTYTPGKQTSVLQESRWHAIYYYPEWDNLMGQFANVKPGENVRWVKTLATFFPEDEEDTGLALPKGFQNFITEVEEVQDRLAEAISLLAKGKNAVATKGATNEAANRTD